MNGITPLFGRPRGKLPIAPQGWPFIIPVAALSLLAWLLCWTIAAGVLVLLLLFLLNFFRDPERNTPIGDGLFVSPADGKVVAAEETADGVRVDIFMNVFNVHVNRAPVKGKIIDMRYTTGDFINASLSQASERNERNRIEIQCADGEKVVITQIAGLLARRIVSYVRVGDEVECGQRIGMIRFGSRVNCEIPAGYTLNVGLGDHVAAGLTVLASKKGERRSDAAEASDDKG